MYATQEYYENRISELERQVGELQEAIEQNPRMTKE